MRRLDVKFDLSLADLVLTRHPKSEATFAHRLGILKAIFSVFFTVQRWCSYNIEQNSDLFSMICMC